MFIKRENAIKTALFRFLAWLLYAPIRLFLDIIYRNDQQNLPPIKNPILLQSATALATKIRTKQIRCTDVMAAYIARMREVQPFVNAIVHERFLDALEDARAADDFLENCGKTEEELAKEKPFLGIPFTVKDTIPIKGMKMTAGFVPLKDHVASKDADVVGIMRRAGAIPVAVTNVPELALWHDANNKLYGRTKNPFRFSRIAGGSSGGEGALIASGGSLIGIGSDFAGSIRIPAFCCGIFGHKPTPGFVPTTGHFPMPNPKLCYMIVQGPMCRYALDLRPSLKVMSDPEKVAELHLDQEVNLKSLKYYYFDNLDAPLIPPVKKEITNALHKVLDHFRQEYSIVPQRVSFKKLQYAVEIWTSKSFEYEEQKTVYSMCANQSGEISPFKELVKHIFGQCDHTLAILLFGGLEKLFRRKENRELVESFIQMASELKDELLSVLGDDGVLLAPTQPFPAIYHRESMVHVAVLGYTGIFNVFEMPATQCPLGLGKEGVPLGLQVAAKPKNDRLTIAVAEEIEKVFGGWVKPCETAI